MTDYYDVTGSPATDSFGDSATIRAEFSAIQSGLSEKLPTLTGNGDGHVKVNAGGTAMETITTAALAILIAASPLAIADSATNTVTSAITVQHTTDASVAAGFGTGIDYVAECTDGNEIGMTLSAITTDVGSGTEAFDFVVNLMAGGSAAAEKFRVASDGSVTMRGGSITDTTGAISFGNENLSTTGTLASGTHTISGNIAFNTSNPNILGNDADGVLQIDPGANVSDGANLTLYGSTHSTQAYDIRIRAGATVKVFRDNSASQIFFADSMVVGTTAVAPDGTLHVHTATAGTVEANSSANDLVVESGGNTGISVLAPDASQAQIYFGSPTNNLGAFARWVRDDSQFKIGTAVGGSSLIFQTGAAIDNLTLSGTTGSELATFAGDVVLSEGKLTITDTTAEKAFVVTSSATTTDASQIVADSLTTASALAVYSNGADTSARSVMFVHNDNALAVGATAMRVRQDSSATGIIIAQNGNGLALNIDSEATTQNCINCQAPTSNYMMDLNNQHATNPFGVLLEFSASAPDNNTNTFLLCTDNVAPRCIIYSDGDLANHDGVYGTISDRKFKTDIIDLDVGYYWNAFRSVQFRKYKMISDVEVYGENASSRLGVIADELETLFPALIKKGEDYDTVKSSILFGPIMASVVQQLQDDVTTLKRQIIRNSQTR